MGQALYRKYRSKSLDELVGQEHITRTLAEAIRTGRIAHAYLLTGPRGVGKTSTARILAHAINDLPYDEKQPHLDIIEIDAASNNSVEDIRDLREKVYVAPTAGKYKVYIIDEVHMLSKAAFNAILKTLEEPPAHAVFILATTEAHKLPATIISRTQRFVFRPIAEEQAVKHLRSIAEAEGIDIADGALELLARHGDGSFRDSISLLDQASSLGTRIDVPAIEALLGIPAGSAIQALTDDVTANPIALGTALQRLYELYDQGFQAAAIAHELSGQLRQRLISGAIAANPQLLQLLGQLLDVPTKRDPERYLEVTLLGLGTLGPTAPVAGPASSPALPDRTAAPAATTAQKSSALPRTKPGQPKAATQSDPPAEQPKKTPAPYHPPDSKRDEAADTTDHDTTEHSVAVDDSLWPQVLNELKKQYNTLYGIIRMAHVTFTDQDEVRLGFAFAFHQKRVNEAKNRKIISDIIERLSGRRLQISCFNDAELKSVKPGVSNVMPADAAQQRGKDDTPESLAAISNIFGGGELLQ